MAIVADIEAGGTDTDAVSRIALWFRRRPLFTLSATAATGFYAAKWRFPRHRRIATQCVPDHTLCFHLGGATSISKRSDGRSTHKRSGPGATSFVPLGEGAHYAVSGEVTLIEIYISPLLMHRFCEECADTARPVSIQPFFVVHDPWLKGYAQMLASEMALYRGGSCAVDSLLLEQSQQWLFAHLLRRYSDLGAHGRRLLDDAAPVRRLPLPLLNRVTNFVEQNLSADIRLADLAALVHLSERHFIRAFRATTGVTPYHYVIENRLRAAARLLHIDDVGSIARVAQLSGFKSQSHFAAEFKAHYQVTPTRYRRLRRSR